MSDKLELEKHAKICLGVSASLRVCRGCPKTISEHVSKIYFSRFFEVFFFHPESQIHVRSGDLKGSKLIRKTRFEVLRSSQSAQGMCRNDPRTSLEKVIF